MSMLRNISNQTKLTRQFRKDEKVFVANDNCIGRIKHVGSQYSGHRLEILDDGTRDVFDYEIHKIILIEKGRRENVDAANYRVVDRYSIVGKDFGAIGELHIRRWYKHRHIRADIRIERIVKNGAVVYQARGF